MRLKTNLCWGYFGLKFTDLNIRRSAVILLLLLYRNSMYLVKLYYQANLCSKVLLSKVYESYSGFPKINHGGSTEIYIILPQLKNNRVTGFMR